MTPRIYAARFAARMLLRSIWNGSEQGAAREILRNAPDLAVHRLGLTVERTPAILGDNLIAGALDREQMRIQLATKFRITSQRFTLAHEIGHFLLHPGTIYFRDRELSAPGEHREYFEIEADGFAAELLMPRKFLAAVFHHMYGGPIDGTVPDVNLPSALVKIGTQIECTPKEFAHLSPLTRACAIASAHAHKGAFFSSLTEQFNVSAKAMGIQLLQMGLVR